MTWVYRASHVIPLIVVYLGAQGNGQPNRQRLGSLPHNASSYETAWGDRTEAKSKFATSADQL